MTIFNLRIITKREEEEETKRHPGRGACRVDNFPFSLLHWLARQCFQDIAPRFSVMFSATFNPGFILAPSSFRSPRLGPLGDAFQGSKAAAS